MSCDKGFLSILITTAVLVIHFYISQDKLVKDKLENVVAPLTIVRADGVIEVSHVTRIESQQENRTLITTLCTDKKCSENCTHYDSPVSQCYNGKDLSPSTFDDNTTNPFGIYDIVDDVIITNYDPMAFKRLFFGSTNGTCAGNVTDSFNYIPLDECVGPFGPPRPCGTFHLVDNVDDPPEEVAIVSY